MIGFVPIKCETELNISGEITDSIFIAQCCSRKMIRKKPESAIKNFLAIDVIPLDVNIVF